MITVGIIGAGAFGTFIGRILHSSHPEIVVRYHSRRAVVDGETYFSLEDVAQADYVVPAVPIHAFKETVLRIAPHLGKESVVVDVATVKEYTSAILRDVLPGRPYIATHPMFGPESYAKRGDSLAGLVLVITEATVSEDRLAMLITEATRAGLVVRRMTSAEHDHVLARTLFFTHLVGQITLGAGIGRTEMDTASFGMLMDAVESVAHDTDLFKDVYRYTKDAPAVLEAFHRSAEGVVQSLEKDIDKRK